MIEATRNIFSYIGEADIICITTNGIVKSNGEAVMGAGVALAAKKRWPGIEKVLATHLKFCGNIPGYLLDSKMNKKSTSVWSFPTKNNWKHNSDIDLIIKSATFFMEEFPNMKQIIIPAPGCSNGGLKWEFVKEKLSFLDDRFIISLWSKD